ncbi:MAG: hypothetical protein KC548_04530, partial [Nanoarchaeota archaeon]|nr:hypothetical protein [Nanoarchaeota archaeon]
LKTSELIMATTMRRRTARIAPIPCFCPFFILTYGQEKCICILGVTLEGKLAGCEWRGRNRER